MTTHNPIGQVVQEQFEQWRKGKTRALVAIRYPAAVTMPVAYDAACKWLRKQAEDGRCSYHIERRGKLVAHIVRRP